MTANEYLEYLIAAAQSDIRVQAHELGLLRRLIAEEKTGVYTP